MSAILGRVAVPEDAGAIARVHVALWRAAYAGLVPASYLNALDVAERERGWREAMAEQPGGQLTFVARIDGEIVGFAAVARCRDEAENPGNRGQAPSQTP